MTDQRETTRLTPDEQRVMSAALRRSATVLPDYRDLEIAWLRHVYEGCARALCARDGIEPDAVISDGGHVAWQLHGYEEARKTLGEPK